MRGALTPEDRGTELPAEAEEFLAWLSAEKGRSPLTLRAYETDLRAYFCWISGADLAVGLLRPEDLDQYVAYLRGVGKAPSSVARALVPVRSLHRFLVAEGMSEVDPGTLLASPQVPTGLPKALTEDEVSTLIDVVAAAPDTAVARRDLAIVELLYGTGMRVSELCGLSLDDFDAESRLVRVFGKRSKERLLPLGRMAIAAVDRWLEPGGRAILVPQQWAKRGDSDALLLNTRGARMTRQAAWQVVAKWARIVGMDDELSPHVLRHSYATHLVQRGADVRTVQELLGHASLSTTQIYTKVLPERLRVVYDAAHPRARRRQPE